MRILIPGAGGQVGRALVAELPAATALDHGAFDVANAANRDRLGGLRHGRQARRRSPPGRHAPIPGLGAVDAAADHGVTLVHLSTEYVFDGAAAQPYGEDTAVAPLNAYGASKAAGDAAVRMLEGHYLVRPTRVVGEGGNFVCTMLSLAAKGIEPAVVADQIGRPTFASDIAAAIVHLLRIDAPCGTYQRHQAVATRSPGPKSLARPYELAGYEHLRVRDTSTAAYFADQPHAPRRPLNSVLDLRKTAAAGVALPWAGGSTSPTTYAASPGEPVADDHEYVARAAVLQFGEHVQPALGTHSPKDVAVALAGDRERDVDRPDRDLPVTDLHVDRIDDDDRVDRIREQVLPRQSSRGPCR